MWAENASIQYDKKKSLAFLKMNAYMHLLS